MAIADRADVIRSIASSNFLRGAGLHIAAQACQALITLAFLTLYARRMSAAEYGAIATYMSFSTLFGLVLYLSLREKAYYATLGKEDDASLTVSSVVWFMLAVAACAIPLTGVIAWAYRERTFFGLPLFPHVFCAQISAVGVVLLGTLAGTLQAVSKLGRAAMMNLAAFLLFGALNLGLLLNVAMDSASYVYAHSAAYGIAGLLAATQLFRVHGFGFSWAHFGKAAAFSIPLVAHNGAHWGRLYVDRVILSGVISTTATGLYGMAAAYCAMPLLIAEGFAVAYTPRFFALVQDSERNARRICSMLPVSVGGAAILATLLSLIADDLFRAVAAPEYWGASAYVPLLCVSLPLIVTYFNIVPILMFRGRTGLASAATVSSVVIGMGTAAALLPALGIWAMPIGIVLLNACMVSLVVAFAQRELPLRWPYMKTATFCLLPILAYGSAIRDGGWMERALLFAVAAAYVAFSIRPHVRTLLVRS